MGFLKEQSIIARNLNIDKNLNVGTFSETSLELYPYLMGYLVLDKQIELMQKRNEMFVDNELADLQVKKRNLENDQKVTKVRRNIKNNAN